MSNVESPTAGRVTGSSDDLVNTAYRDLQGIEFVLGVAVQASGTVDSIESSPQLHGNQLWRWLVLLQSSRVDTD